MAPRDHCKLRRKEIGITSIFSAAEKGSVEDVKYFTEAKSSDVNEKGKNGSPLHYAAENANLEVARYLVFNGADVNALGCFGETPLHWAARHEKNLEVAKFLVSKGANVNAKANDGNGDYTPLYLAEFRGNIQSALFLIAEGADVSTKNELASTPINIKIDRSVRKGGMSEVEINCNVINDIKGEIKRGMVIKIVGGRECVITRIVKNSRGNYYFANTLTKPPLLRLLELQLVDERKFLACECSVEDTIDILKELLELDKTKESGESGNTESS